MKYKLVIAFSALIISCSALAVPFKAIDKETFNGAWPFNADEVQLQCLNGNPYVMNFNDNEVYALAGAAQVQGRSWGARPLDNENKFWLDDKKTKGLKISLSDVTKVAFDLCEK